METSILVKTFLYIGNVIAKRKKFLRRRCFAEQKRPNSGRNENLHAMMIRGYSKPVPTLTPSTTRFKNARLAVIQFGISKAELCNEAGQASS